MVSSLFRPLLLIYFFPRLLSPVPPIVAASHLTGGNRREPIVDSSRASSDNSIDRLPMSDLDRG